MPIKSIRSENKELKAKIERLKVENQKQLEKILLQLEEIQILKFGKKRRNKKLEVILIPETEGRKEEQVEKKKPKREASSYRRPKPKAEEVTDYLRLEIEVCPECGERLTDKKDHIHYREDLREVEKLLETAKKIVETKVESGQCPHCRKRQFAMEVPKQKVIIGENIRRMVVYQTIIQGLSYNEVRKSMKELYGIEFGQGEVFNILEGESRLLIPYYNYLVEELKKESKEYGAHYDETSWKTKSMGGVVSEGNYCWIKIGIQSQLRLIWFGQSRGKQVAEQLRGEKKGSKGISDDYGAYTNCFEDHGLCWAHPNRKFKYLAESENLSGKAKKACQKTYKNFAKTYKKAERIRQQLLKEVLSEEEKQKARKALEKEIDQIVIKTEHDPEKLKTLKETLLERKDKYFTFFKYPWFSLDNNKAERAIKRVVLKRKKSFGCRSQKGADVLSILYSVIFSLVETYPDENFFSLYKKVVDFDENTEI